MYRELKANERLVQCAIMGHRRADGSVECSEPVYRIVKIGELNEETGMTREDEQACEDIAAVLGNLFGEYVRAAGLE